LNHARRKRQDDEVRLAPLTLVSALLACAQNSAAPSSGEHVKVDERNGLIQYWQEGKKGLVLSSTRFGFTVALPYSEHWQFTSDDTQPLRGNAGPYNVTVEIVSASEPPARYLRSWMNNLVARTPGIVTAQILDTENGPLLRADQDVAQMPGGEQFRGAHQLHLFVAREARGALYTLHFSMIGPVVALDAEELQLRKNVENFRGPD